MHILFVADPLAQFHIKKDTTFAMMREAQRRGHTISVCEPQHIQWQKGAGVTATAHQIRLTGEPLNWFVVTATDVQALHMFDVVLMRKDPPFDSEYFYCTHLLSQAQREGAVVINSPQALRDHPEKLSIMEFAQYIGPTIVTRQMAAVRDFHAEHQDIILKPLDGMGGKGIFRVQAGGLNLGSMVEMLTQNGSESIMVQKFLPEIDQGDKRILIIAGKPVPYALARIPQNGEVRGNLAAGGKGVAQPLTQSDWDIATAIGPILFARGLWLVGLDVIGNAVTEINVTSPTCFQEIHDQTGCDVSALWMDAVEQAPLARTI
jgi:glutathione synthase